MTFEELCNKVAKDLPEGWLIKVEIGNNGIRLCARPPNLQVGISLECDDESTLEQQMQQLVTMAKEYV